MMVRDGSTDAEGQCEPYNQSKQASCLSAKRSKSISAHLTVVMLSASAVCVCVCAYICVCA